MEDLEFPILLDKSVGEDGIVIERGPEHGIEHACELGRGYVLRSETTRRFCMKGRTWRTTFPDASITS